LTRATLAACAEEQQGDVRALADASAHVEARAATQHHVENHAVDATAIQRLERLAGVGGGEHPEPCDGQEVRQ
jgi:hypothetical protein